MVGRAGGGGQSAEDEGRYVVGRWWQDELEGVGRWKGWGQGGMAMDGGRDKVPMG